MIEVSTERLDDPELLTEFNYVVIVEVPEVLSVDTFFIKVDDQGRVTQASDWDWVTVLGFNPDQDVIVYADEDDAPYLTAAYR